jgi:hypothetical protein
MISDKQYNDVRAEIKRIREKLVNFASGFGGMSYTPEDVARKSTDGTLAANSTSLYPSQSAVKTYVDTHVAGTIGVLDTADTSCFVALFEDATGNLAPKTDAGLTYNAGTGVLTATGFSGPLSGNVTGNVSGTAATVTGAAQASITSLGTLTTLTVDNITIDGSSITGISDANTVMTAYAGRAIAIEGVSFDNGAVSGLATITPTADSTTAFRILKQADGTAVLTVDTSNGYIGVGITPTKLFEIASASVPTFRISNGASGSNNMAIQLWRADSDAAMLLYRVGGTSVGGLHIVSTRTDAGGIFFHTAGDLSTASPSNERMRIGYDGNVFIGTTTTTGTIGRCTIKGSTADGTTNCLVLRDSAEANVEWHDTDGNFSNIGYHYRSVSAAITAGTTQTQAGATALTSETNNISTCGTASDCVKLPSAVAGMRIIIRNSGAQVAAIWPASGDDLGAGVNTVSATTLATGKTVQYDAIDATNWKETFLN